MILKSVLELRENIDKDRQKMYELTKKLGISDPCVIQISQQIDKEIVKLQKIMKAISTW